MRINHVLKLIFVFVAVAGVSGCEVVEDGQQGVLKRFGKISDESLTPGLQLNIPLVREVEVWNVKTQRHSLRLDTPSNEGLIVRLEATVLFRPLDVVAIRKTIGQAYIQTVVDSQLRDAFREVIGKERVEAVYKNPDRLGSLAKEALKARLEVRGILVEDLLVTDLELPPTLKEAIETKLQSEQRALQKEFDLQQAQKDAEIEVAKAKGVAQAQEIVRATLSPEYLQYLWISKLSQNPNVIYVATEANMPMFRTSGEQDKRRPAAASTPSAESSKASTSTAGQERQQSGK